MAAVLGISGDDRDAAAALVIDAVIDAVIIAVVRSPACEVS
jgi:hypothetical protein